MDRDKQLKELAKEFINNVKELFCQKGYVTLDEEGEPHNVRTLSDAETLQLLQEMQDYISEMDKEAGYIYSKVSEGTTIIPYTEGYGNMWSWQMAGNIMDTVSQYSYVSDTVQGVVIMSDDFSDLLKKATGNGDKEYINGLLWGTQDKDNIKSAVPILNADKTPMDTTVVAHVDYLSDRVMSQEIGNAKGDVLALVSNSKDYNVFIRTEFDTLIHNESVNTINSISKKNYIHHHHRNQYNIVQIQYLQEFFQVCSLEKCCMHEKVPVLLEVTANKSRDKFLK